MEEFANRIIKLESNEDSDQVMKMVSVLFDENNEQFNETQRLSLFDLLLTTISHVDNYATDILIVANDIHMVEKTLSALSYTVHRSLNACLSIIANLEILNYIVTHPYAKFRVNYRQSEALRYAVLNCEMDRLGVLLLGRHGDVHDRGSTTNGKSAVELAVMFDNKMAIKMFLGAGFVCVNDGYTQFVNNYVSDIELQRSVEKIELVSVLNDKYVRDGELDFKSMLKLTEDTVDPLKELSMAVVLRHHFRKIDEFTSGCRGV